jgi:predicted DCC family thiol-disulfide oxidoreductase YuxK
MSHPILLYDGVCGLCNRLVQFVLKHETTARFRFASLQSDYAIRILRQHALNPHELDTVYVIETPGAQPQSRSDGVISVLRTLGGFWTAVATTLRILPRPLRDWGYNIVARHRYRVFGKYEACPIPEKKYMGRFLDIASPPPPRESS